MVESQLGHEVSEETRRKISVANRGKKRQWASPEARAAYVASVIECWTGRKHSEASKARMRAVKLGKKPTVVARAKMRLAAIRNSTPERLEILRLGRELMRGKPHTEETKAKLRAANLGKKRRERSPEEKEALRIRYSAIHKGRGIGRKATDEAKAKMSASRIGLRRSDETKAKMRVAAARRTYEQKATWLGRKHSEETREKCRLAKLGTKHSAETRARMSVAKKAWHASKTIEQS